MITYLPGHCFISHTCDYQEEDSSIALALLTTKVNEIHIIPCSTNPKGLVDPVTVNARYMLSHNTQVIIKPEGMSKEWYEMVESSLLLVLNNNIISTC